MPLSKKTTDQIRKEADERAGNGGIYGGERTVRSDKTIAFDSHVYFSLDLLYYLRQRVWVEYDGDNFRCRVNVYNNNSAYKRLICTIDDSEQFK